MAATDVVRNFAKVAVATGYGSGDTSILLSSSDPNIGNIPDPATYGQYNLVWWNNTTYSDPADDPNKEIIRVTAKSLYTLTITRAQEGTSATAKNATSCTYKVVMAPTRKFRDDLETAIVEYGPYYGTVKEYGAVGNGSTDDYAAFNSAKGTLTHIVLNSGTYRIGTNITFGSGITLEFLQGAQLVPDSGITVTIQGNIIAPNNQIFAGTGTVSADSRHSLEHGRWWGQSTDPDILSTGAIKAATGVRDGLAWQSGATQRSKISFLGNSITNGISGSTPSAWTFRKEQFTTASIASWWTKDCLGPCMFDGRYFYITDNTGSSVCWLGRYDTTQAFAGTQPPWEYVNIQTYQSDFCYPAGACFDGRYIYLWGYSKGSSTSDLLLRYDTTLPLAYSGSYQVKDMSAVDSSLTAGCYLFFDGRYVYGVADSANDHDTWRYDTTLQFSENSSYSTFSIYGVSVNYTRHNGMCFDGRYIYYAPRRTDTSYNYAARYDTTASFTSSGSWSFFNLDTLVTSVYIPCNACFCDGRYIYFSAGSLVTNPDGYLPRYDTTLDFTSASAWTTFKSKDVGSSLVGAYGISSDGRNIFFHGDDGKMLVYDRWKPFSKVASWKYGDALAFHSGEHFEAYTSATDGNYIYFPSYNDTYYQVWRVAVHPESGFLHHPASQRQQIDGWYQDDVTASQSAVTLSRLSGACTNAFIAPSDGSITKVCVYSNDARTAGTLTVEPYVNGAATGLTAVINGTDTTFATGIQTADKDLFVAGDRIDIRITTDGSWAPTTADIRASLEIVI